MKRVILLSVGFPFGNHELFLRGELKYHKQLTLASAFMGDERRVKNNMPDDVNITLWHYSSPFFRGNKAARVLSAVGAFFTPDFWRELHSEDIAPVQPHKVLTLLSFISKANEIVSFVSNEIEKSDYKNDELIFYSYWMDHLAFAAVKLAEKYNGKAVTRCHGYDVYPRDGGYVVMQRYLARKLDRIFPIADDGKKTICSLFQFDKSIDSKITVFRLGTEDRGINPQITSKTVFTIVSCSNVVPLKRVEMIFDAISQIHEFKIRWIHFGDGPCLDHLRDKVSHSGCIHQVELMGRQSNQAIMDFYKKTPIHLLINLSTSEGIPVSMMEALSFGIPCLGTDVGGVHEIIKNNVNGYLIQEGCTVDDVADVIRRVRLLPMEEMLAMRERARFFWKENYRASKNYTMFVECLEKEM